MGNPFILLVGLFFISEICERGPEKLEMFISLTLDPRHDEVAEWLRRWTANPMGSARVGSNPILVVNFFHAFTQVTFLYES